MGKRQPSAAAKRHMGRVADLGCIVCRNEGNPGTAAECHHINRCAMGMRSGSFLVIPLCPEHHRTSSRAVHQGKQTFEMRYGDEWALLDQTLELLEE